MHPEWTDAQRQIREQFRAFVDAEIRPHARRFDAEQRLSSDLAHRIGGRGLLIGDGLDALSLGLLHETVGAVCASTRSLLTVQGMVAAAIRRWGSATQRERWLPALANGTTVAAFALSEPDAGSDACSLQCTAHADGEGFRLHGVKTWISFAEIAGLILLIARLDGQLTAFLVERDTAGLTVEPIRGLLGARASMLGTMRFEACHVPASARIGGVGFGFAAVAATALDYGRYSVAWGSTGAAGACLEAAITHARERKQFGKPLAEQALVQRLLTRMVVQVQSARLLCARAGWLRQNQHPAAVSETSLAKYQATVCASAVATDALQLLGARGIGGEADVERHFRDARVMELIEGSTQIQEIVLGARAVSGEAWLL